MDSLSNIFSTAQLLNNMIGFNRTPADFYKNLNNRSPVFNATFPE
jgi:hypothetical protein